MRACNTCGKNKPLTDFHKTGEMRTCKIDHCNLPSRSRGWCEKHYVRWYRHGSPHTTLRNRESVTWEHLLSKSTLNPKTSCIEWNQSTSTGYGVLQYKGKVVRTHRISYELNIGPIPDGLFVCHHCDNRICINPNHLFIGTQLDNIRDMIAKGRGSPHRGEASGTSIFTESDVLHIRKTYKGRYGECKQLMKKYGVSKSTILAVMNRTSWRHI